MNSGAYKTISIDNKKGREGRAVSSEVYRRTVDSGVLSRIWLISIMYIWMRFSLGQRECAIGMEVPPSHNSWLPLERWKEGRGEEGQDIDQ